MIGDDGNKDATDKDELADYDELVLRLREKLSVMSSWKQDHFEEGARNLLVIAWS